MISKVVQRTLKASTLVLLMLLPSTGEAQRLLTLDSCRAMALRNNKQMSVARVKQEVNANLRQSARTKYLPQVNALGGYVWMSKEVSILNDDQKTTLKDMGTNASTSLQNGLAPLVGQLPAGQQAKVAEDLSQFAGALNQMGQHIVDSKLLDRKVVPLLVHPDEMAERVLKFGRMFMDRKTADKLDKSVAEIEAMLKARKEGSEDDH